MVAWQSRCCFGNTLDTALDELRMTTVLVAYVLRVNDWLSHRCGCSACAAVNYEPLHPHGVEAWLLVLTAQITHQAQICAQAQAQARSCASLQRADNI